MALTRDQYAFIVSQRATFITPDAIVAAFPRRFNGEKITLDDVALCERDKLPPDWIAYADAELAKFLDAPTAKLEVRVAELNRMYVKERDRGAACAQYLEQIAKEMAGAYAPKGAVGKAPAAGGDVPAEITAITRTVVDPAPIE